MKTCKRTLSALLAVLMIVGAALTVGAANVAFTDVATHWAWTNGQIPYLVDKGVLNGYAQNNGTYLFKPDGIVTRAEFIKMLDETFGLTQTAPISFRDVADDSWYAPYFQKAAAQGYLLNYGNSVAPDGKIMREEATALLVRYLNLPADEAAPSSSLADYDEISDNFKNYVLRAVQNGIINGYNEGGKTLFKPQQTLTRAEALTILYRAAGCIYNESAYTRSASAYESNNTITRGGVTVTNVRFNGRNIVSEGANDGTVTFSDCTINGTLTVRGGADIRLDNTTADKIILQGGGSLSLVSRSSVKELVVEASSEIGVFTGTKIELLTVQNGANFTKVTGDGAISKAIIQAKNFSSSMVPTEFEVGNNLDASFGGTDYEGSSDAQDAFETEPFSSSDETSRYINVFPAADGTLYYYYTNSASLPSTAAFDSYYMESNYGSNKNIMSGQPISIATYANNEVEHFDYIILQLQNGTRKYKPVVIQNLATDGTGFTTDPYLAEETTIKFQPMTAGTLLWYYAEDGAALSPLTFLKNYNSTESALRGELSVNSIKSFSCTLNKTYLSTHSFVAFMLTTPNGYYYQPVVIAAGNSGFSVKPTVKTPGVISYTANVSGDLYYYYTDTTDIPSAENFKSEYNAAREASHETIRKISGAELKYNTELIDRYPYMVLAIRLPDGSFLQPVLVNIYFTTGFADEPTVKSSSQITFSTETEGTVRYYYTKDSAAPSIDEFNAEYARLAAKYTGAKAVRNTLSQEIEIDTVIAASNPYMVIMFTDDKGTEYSPVILALDVTSKSGFLISPYADNGKVLFRTDSDCEVYYFYDRVGSNVSADEFYEYYQNTSSDKRHSVSASKDSLTSFTYDQEFVDGKYRYIVLAICTNEKYHDFAWPIVLDVRTSENTSSVTGTGLEFGTPNEDEVRVEALYDGTLYYYRTDDKDDIADSARYFASYYSDASSEGSIKMEKGDREYLEFKNYDYIVCSLYVDGDYLSVVTITREGVETEGSARKELAYNKSGYGFQPYGYGNDSIVVLPSVSGKITLYAYDAARNDFSSVGSYDAVADETCEIEYPSYLMNNALFDLLFGGGSFSFTDTAFYIQLQSGSNVYEAYELNW